MTMTSFIFQDIKTRQRRAFISIVYGCRDAGRNEMIVTNTECMRVMGSGFWVPGLEQKIEDIHERFKKIGVNCLLTVPGGVSQ